VRYVRGTQSASRYAGVSRGGILFPWHDLGWYGYCSLAMTNEFTVDCVRMDGWMDGWMDMLAESGFGPGWIPSY